MKKIMWILLILGSISSSTSCQHKDKTAAIVEKEQDQDRDKAVQKSSDLDRAVEERFQTTCEHGVKTFACETCRYENGISRVKADLLKEGLIQLATAAQRRLERPLVLTGEVHFDERLVTHINAPIDGIIKKVFVTLGDQVSAGQSLLELESVSLGEAQAAYQEALSLQELAERNYERSMKLRQEAIASEREHLQTRQELEAAKIRVQGALGKLTRYGLRQAKQRRDDGHLIMRAPAEGTVLIMHAVPGERAKTDESQLVIGENSRMWIVADLYERDMAVVLNAQAKERLNAAVTVKAYPGQEFVGQVRFISPVMDEATRSAKVRIEVPNPEHKLLAGMFAEVKIFLPAPKQVLAIPTIAVQEDEGRFFVFIHHHDDYYVRIPISVGQRMAGYTEVIKGLNEGQKIVAQGAFLLKSDVLRAKMGAGCAD